MSVKVRAYGYNTGVKKMDYKWCALGLLWVAFFLQQGTRQLFGPSVSSIMSATGADKVEVGFAGTVFAITYGICVPLAGIAADIFRRKWMVTVGVSIFCLGIFLSGFATTVGLLIVTYGLLNGFGQTFYYPSATSLISQLHSESRATAFSILQLGLYIGIVGGGTVAGWCAGMDSDGWRWPFWTFGAIGVAWAAVMAFFLRDTKPNSVSGTADRPHVTEALKSVFANPTALCLIFGLSMMIYVDIGFKTWMPTYLSETYGSACPFLVKWAGLHAVLWHYLGAVVGIIGGSRIGDRLVNGRLGIRLELGIVGLAAAVPFIIWMAKADSFVSCCAAMGLFGLFRGIYDSNCMAGFFEVVNPRYHASGVGIMMCIAFVFGSLSSVAFPWVQQWGGRVSGMASLSAFYLAGAFAIALARVLFFKRDVSA